MKILPSGIAVLEGDDHISRFVEEAGKLDYEGYNHNMLPPLLDLLKEGDVIIDGGAFIGEQTIAYSQKIGRNGLIVAFEPSEEASKCLCHNVQKFDTHLVTEVCDWALGKTTGEELLFCMDDDFPNSVGSRWLKCGDGNIVTLSIDDLCSVGTDRQWPRLDLIKLDVEGMELQVLEGGANTISTLKPKMVIEVNRKALARQNAMPFMLLDWLNEHRYKWKNIIPGNECVGDLYDILAEPI